MKTQDSRTAEPETGTAPDAAPMQSGRRRRRVVAAVAGVLVVAGASLAALASVSVAETPEARATQNKATQIVQVSGELIPKDASALSYRVRGELIGTWSFPEAETEVLYAPKSGSRVFLKGTEYFTGCVNENGNKECESSEPSGVLRSDYISWSYRDRTGRYVDGGCTHVPTGGTGAFTGVRGLLQMKDVFAATEAGSTSFYQGEVILNAMKDEKPIKVPTLSANLKSSSSALRAAAGC